MANDAWDLPPHSELANTGAGTKELESSLHAMRSALEHRLSLALFTLTPGPMREAIAQSLEGGKRIRPLLSMAACAAAGGDYRDALHSAAAIELLHCASLIHDDIMDQARLRRGKATLHASYGISAAILSGDILIALALRTLHADHRSLAPKILREFSETFLLLCEGQAEDLRFADGQSFASDGHTEMVRKKTAELLASALTIGAMTATDDPQIINALRTFGLCLGLAYQAKDDLLDVVGTEEQTGKSCGVDQRNGRRTFVTIATSNNETIAAVENQITDNTTKALRALDQLPPTPARETLAILARMLVQRTL